MKNRYREYRSVRNFAEYRCVKVKLTKKLNEHELKELEQQIKTVVEGKFTYTHKHFYFENEVDAIIFKLKYNKV